LDVPERIQLFVSGKLDILEKDLELEASWINGKLLYPNDSNYLLNRRRGSSL
jgi:hypothetical protein